MNTLFRLITLRVKTYYMNSKTDHFMFKAIVMLAATISISAAYGARTTPAKAIAGWVENVVIENQAYSVKAKLDSGAKTSSIYAENIELFKKGNKTWVRFTLVLPDAKHSLHRFTLEKPRARRVKVKEHDGEHDRRPVVDLDMCFNGNHYTSEFTLADRKEYIYHVLLGREFLSAKAVIDPEETFLTLGTCHMSNHVTDKVTNKVIATPMPAHSPK